MFDLTTTAVFTPPVQACINYSGVSFGSGPIALLHDEGGTWVNVTTSVDTTNHVVCGNVSSLSPFVVAEVVNAVGPVATTTSLTSSLNPSVFGKAVTFTATTSGSGPTGTVQFFDGATNIGSASLSGGMATLTITALAVGTHPISAVYGSNANNLGSTSNTVNQVVSAVAPQSGSTPIPTVDAWGLALIALALLAAGIDALRRHKPRL